MRREEMLEKITLLFVCSQRQIGWRNQSRKLVVLSTDASFHYAGDGKVIHPYIEFNILCNTMFFHGVIKTLCAKRSVTENRTHQGIAVISQSCTQHTNDWVAGCIVDGRMVLTEETVLSTVFL